jgi:hypothetical protein
MGIPEGRAKQRRAPWATKRKQIPRPKTEPRDDSVSILQPCYRRQRDREAEERIREILRVRIPTEIARPISGERLRDAPPPQCTQWRRALGTPVPLRMTTLGNERQGRHETCFFSCARRLSASIGRKWSRSAARSASRTSRSMGVNSACCSPEPFIGGSPGVSFSLNWRSLCS